MRREPVAPADERRVERDQAPTCGRRRTGDRAAQQLAPQALAAAVRATVVHEQVGVIEQPADAEFEHGAVHRPLEGDGAVARRVVGHDDRHAAERVVDDLVAVEDAQGIGPRLPVDRHADDPIGRHEELAALRLVDACDVTAGNDRRVDQRLQRVLAHARGHELLAADQARLQGEAVRLDVRPVAEQRRAVAAQRAADRPGGDGGGDDRGQQQHPAAGPEGQQVRAGFGVTLFGHRPSRSHRAGAAATTRGPIGAPVRGPRSATIRHSRTGRYTMLATNSRRAQASVRCV
jgi:hypothetical protein